MARAIRLARRGLYSTRPNPRVGCVLVRDGKVVGEGWHEFAGGPHAEIHALEAAANEAAGSTCYVSLEPCRHRGRTGPCTESLTRAGVSRVVAAMTDPNPETGGRGLQDLAAAGIETGCGLLQAQAAELNRGFIKRMTAGLPYVRCKLAMSLDGRTAMADGESRWITSDAARRDVQRLRARSCAVMTGIGTVLADDPRLDVRDIELPHGAPLRVVIDRQLRFPPGAEMLARPGRVLIFACREDADRQDALHRRGAEVHVLPERGFLRRVLSQLAQQEAVNEVLVEAGASLAGALLEEGLIDEVVVYQAPVLMGDAARGLFHLPWIRSMQDRIQLELHELHRIGEDVRLTLTVHGNETNGTEP